MSASPEYGLGEHGSGECVSSVLQTAHPLGGVVAEEGQKGPLLPGANGDIPLWSKHILGSADSLFTGFRASRPEIYLVHARDQAAGFPRTVCKSKGLW